MRSRRSPDVVILSGTIGVGKTAVAEALSDLVHDDIPVALIDLDALSQLHPARSEDPYNDDLALTNLAAIWPNYARLGARRAIIARVVASLDHRRRFGEALDAERLTVVRLTASTTTRRARITARELDEHWRQRFLDRTDTLDEQLAVAGVEDLVVSNDEHSPSVAARQIATGVGWLAVGP